MWQNILVFLVILAAGGFTLWRFYQKFTGKSACCGGGCTCKGGCSSKGSTPGGNASSRDGAGLTPLTCGCGKH